MFVKHDFENYWMHFFSLMITEYNYLFSVQRSHAILTNNLPVQNVMIHEMENH